MPTPNIRPITSKDLSDVLKMVQALAAHHGDTPSITVETLHRDALGPHPWLIVLVAESREGVIGYAALTPLAQMQFGLRGMDMHHLFVREGFRRSGVGRALIEAAKNHCSALDCSYLTVGTHPDNAQAAKAYLAAGFDPLPPPGPRFRVRL